MLLFCGCSDMTKAHQMDYAGRELKLGVEVCRTRVEGSLSSAQGWMDACRQQAAERHMNSPGCLSQFHRGALAERSSFDN